STELLVTIANDQQQISGAQQRSEVLRRDVCVSHPEPAGRLKIAQATIVQELRLDSTCDNKKWAIRPAAQQLERGKDDVEALSPVDASGHDDKGLLDGQSESGAR